MTRKLPQGMYFEEFETGTQIRTPARTITETDVVTFAGLSGDFTELHTNAQMMRENPLFGARVAHGLLVLSIASGLAIRTGMLEGTVLAFREIEDWKFSLPAFFGDTIYVLMTVIDTKAMRRLGGGRVRVKVEIFNQKDELMQSGVWAFLVASRPVDV